MRSTVCAVIGLTLLNSFSANAQSDCFFDKRIGGRACPVGPVQPSDGPGSRPGDKADNTDESRRRAEDIATYNTKAAKVNAAWSAAITAEDWRRILALLDEMRALRGERDVKNAIAMASAFVAWNEAVTAKDFRRAMDKKRDVFTDAHSAYIRGLEEYEKGDKAKAKQRHLEEFVERMAHDAGPSSRSLIVPAACAAWDTETINTACDVVVAGLLGWQLSAAPIHERTMKEVIRMLLEAAGPRVSLAYVFPKSAKLADKIELTKEIYAQQIKLFEYIREEIRRTMIDDPRSQAARRAAAMAWSQDYAKLTEDAVRYAQIASDRTVTLLQGAPSTPRVQNRCAHACGQLIQIYRTGRGWD